MKKESLKLKKPILHVAITSDDNPSLVSNMLAMYLGGLLSVCTGIAALATGVLTPGIICVILTTIVLVTVFRPRIIAKLTGRAYVKTGYRGQIQINEINSLAHELESTAVNLKRGDSTNVDEVFNISQTLINEAVVLVKSLSLSGRQGLHFSAEEYRCSCATCDKAAQSIQTIRLTLESAITAVSQIAEETRNLSRTQIESLKKVTKRLGDEANHISEAKKELAAL